MTQVGHLYENKIILSIMKKKGNNKLKIGLAILNLQFNVFNGFIFLIYFNLFF